ncbi:HK97 family phage prohead protease [Bradyrhizobium sp. 186]|uniref:HK97 family phage prohead protease n=1 Tax=Bradyrhizobium sp. 186 TaxID=2782654 RepID=UPI002000DDEF|nr:HK97 family phage prohead protease [Bradyrhizobium sp. 186]UPK40112.1 HK97 family phage prohead protease [Bradyrhizobium sp. 186]
MGEPAITGYAISWNQPAVIAGSWEERFARGAFDVHLQEKPDVVALWAHDVSRPLARVSNGTLKLRSDLAGLWYSITPNPDSPLGQEAVAMVGTDTVNEVSVGFSSEIEEWEDTDSLPRRLITQARLIEVSIVLFGAFGKNTSAGIRSANNSQAAKRRIEAAQRRRGILR